MNKIDISKVSKSFSEFKALSEVSITLKSGETHALMGENGAGKSTLIKIIAGVLRANKFVLKIDDSIKQLHSVYDSKKLGFRFIHQELNIIPQISVAENMLLSLNFPKFGKLIIDWKKLYHLADNALKELGATHINSREKCGNLSTGDQILMKTASCLVSDSKALPSLYVFDEPTAALTFEESNNLFAVIERLRSNGAAILYVSHRLNEVFKICDKITVLRDGKNVCTVNTCNTTKEEIITSMTGKKLDKSLHTKKYSVVNKPILTLNWASTRKIRNINFDLYKGEIIGVAGLANSGQSELLRMILGIDVLTSGSMRLEQKSFKPKNPNNAWSQGISYLPKERRTEALMLKMSVRVNTVAPHYSIFSRLGFISHSIKESEKSLSLAKLVKLKFRELEQPVCELSGGNQQKVIFSRALVSNPKILLLDEPTRGVDIGSKFDIYSLISDLRKNGCSIIIVSSDLPEILALSDRIIILQKHSQSKILESFPATSKELLTEIYTNGAA